MVEPRDILRCQRVCRDWSQAFSNPEILYPALKYFFPRAREARELRDEGRARGAKENLCSESSISYDWRRVFTLVSSRYHFLGLGKPYTIQKLSQLSFDERTYYCPVSPWQEHESFAPAGPRYLFDHAFWSYKDGLLAFLEEEQRSITVLDVATGTRAIAPFDLLDRVIRNIRLNEKLLIVEWAEIESFHQLNANEPVHRHFATSFEVLQEENVQLAATCQTLELAFRNEWKMHFLGLPLSDRDRFFSDHTNTHYAIYIWQPNRSMYTGSEIESLAVWDVSHPSKYHPSTDASGRLEPGDHKINGPHVVHRFNFHDLDHFGILQKDSPLLMSFHIDDAADNIYWYENEYMRPTNAFNLGHGEWRSRTVTIPLAIGAVNSRYNDIRLPPYAGNCSLDASRHRDIPKESVLGVMETADEEADVTYSVLRTNISGPFNTTLVKIHLLGNTVDLEEKFSNQVSYKGKLAGDERFLIGENDRQEIVILHFNAMENKGNGPT
ncbi:MAG: hypothetical protein Q9227_007516 [Pyrenula ochraceoflavens]